MNGILGAIIEELDSIYNDIFTDILSFKKMPGKIGLKGVAVNFRDEERSMKDAY